MNFSSRIAKSLPQIILWLLYGVIIAGVLAIASKLFSTPMATGVIIGLIVGLIIGQVIRKIWKQSKL